ncbi:Ger(x)C family spore germination protein [Bacillus sp. EB600]|uniref:Ger(x)C family spore germination protein n=1 Tax=Bacillus sp. EB600 TaxID=2806345 RepID=UPI00210BD6DE|nr:Ger(x)C family spore germination protein [Bacillus sp. EB600]MCQ6282477.1 Ger(x)C family spore germination protein [Bacillus sp. EB600]
MSSFVKKKNILLVLLFLFVTPLLSVGCGFKDIDKRIFIIGVGLDKNDSRGKPYRITLKLAVLLGSTKNSPKPEYTYLTRESKTVAGGVQLLKSHIDKELDFGHSKVIVFGEKILEEDMRVLSDFFLRRRDLQQISWVSVGSPSAEAVLKSKPSAEVSGANVLFNLFSGVGTNSSNTVSTYLFDFRRQLIEDGIDAVLPIIETDKKRKTMIVNKSIVFKDRKGKVELNPDQSEIYNILTSKMDTINLIIPIPNKKNEVFSAFMEKTNTKYWIEPLSNHEYVLKMNVKMAGIVEESKIRLSQFKLNQYNKLAGKEAKKRILTFLSDMHKNGVDPIGFGLRYQATHLDNQNRANEWNQIYPNLKFDVSVKVDIKDVGTTE